MHACERDRSESSLFADYRNPCRNLMRVAMPSANMYHRRELAVPFQLSLACLGLRADVRSEIA
jgi:hypothetical protein